MAFNLSRLRILFEGDTTRADAAFAKVRSETTKTRKHTGALAAGIATGFTVAAVAGLRSVIKVGDEYQKNLNMLQGVTDATAAQLATMDQKAQDLGNDLTLPATSAAGAARAMLELAKGGFSVQQSMDAAKATLQLAAAAQISETEAAKATTAAMHSFGLEAKDAQFAIDAISNAANASSANVSDVTYAFESAAQVFSKFQGPAVGAKGAITELTAAIAVLNNAGIKGSMAGTTLRSAMLHLSSPTNKVLNLSTALYASTLKQTASHKELTAMINGNTKERDKAVNSVLAHNKALYKGGDIAYDAAGKARPLTEQLHLLNKATQGMSQQDKNGIFKQLFGTYGINAALALTGEGTKKFEDMAKKVTVVGGAAKMAKAQMQGLPGAWEALKSNIEGVSVVIYRAMQGDLAGWVMGAAKAVKSLTGEIPTIIKHIKEFWASTSGLRKEIATTAEYIGTNLLKVLDQMGITGGKAGKTYKEFLHQLTDPQSGLRKFTRAIMTILEKASDFLVWVTSGTKGAKLFLAALLLMGGIYGTVKALMALEKAATLMNAALVLAPGKWTAFRTAINPIAGETGNLLTKLKDISKVSMPKWGKVKAPTFEPPKPYKIKVSYDKPGQTELFKPTTGVKEVEQTALPFEKSAAESFGKEAAKGFSSSFFGAIGGMFTASSIKGVFMKVGPKIVAAVGGMFTSGGVLAAIGEAIAGFFAAVAAVVGAPVWVVVLAAVLIAAAIAAIIKWRHQIWHAITQAWDWVWKKMVALGNWFGGIDFGKMGSEVGNWIWGGLKKAASWVASKATDLWNGASDWLTSGLASAMDSVRHHLSQFGSDIWNGLKDGVAWVGTKASDLWSGAVDWFTGLAKAVGRGLVALPGIIVSGIGEAIGMAFGALAYLFIGLPFQIGKWLRKNGPAIAKALKDSFMGAVTGVRDFFTKTIPSVIDSGIDWIVGRWKAFTGWTSRMWDSVTGAVANAYHATIDWFKGLPAAASAAWGAVVSAALDAYHATIDWFKSLPGYAVRAWGAVKSAAVDAWNAVKSWTLDAYHAVIDFFVGVGRSAADAWGAVTDAVSSAYHATIDWFKGLPAVVSRAWSRTVSNVRAAISRAWGVIRAVPGQIGRAFSSLAGIVGRAIGRALSYLSALPGRVGRFMARIPHLVGHAFGQLPHLALRAIQGINKWLMSGWIGKAVRWVADKLTGGFRKGWDKVQVMTDGAVGDAVKALQGMAGKAWRAVKDVGSRILDAAKDFGTYLLDAGRWLIEGLWNGMAGAGSWLWDKVVGFAKSFIMDPLQSVFHWGSPSKTMRKRGGWITEGWALGMQDNLHMVKRAALDAADLATLQFANPDEIMNRIAGGRNLGTLALGDNTTTVKHVHTVTIDFSGMPAGVDMAAVQRVAEAAATKAASSAVNNVVSKVKVGRS